MNLMIDTNAYSDFFRGNEKVRERMETAETLFIPPPVAGELMAGFFQGTRKDQNIREMDHILTLPGVQLTSIGLKEARLYGTLVKQLKQAGTPLPTNDIWIAASALSLGVPLLTRDRHFECISGLMVENF